MNPSFAFRLGAFRRFSSLKEKVCRNLPGVRLFLKKIRKRESFRAFSSPEPDFRRTDLKGTGCLAFTLRRFSGAHVRADGERKKNFACCGISPKFILPERSTAQRRNPHGPSLRRRIPFSGTAPPRQKNSASFVHGNPRRLFRAEIVPGERRNKSFVRREKMTLRAG